MAGKVVGIGGVFFKVKDAARLREWYTRVLGFTIDDWGGLAFKSGLFAEIPGSVQVWSPFNADTKYFEPSTKDFMINLMVDDLDGVLARCTKEGVTPTSRDDSDPNGRFAHIIDPEGIKIELWQPKAPS
jgi:catechol 2,3-dioxygenase-like lactoylglutathione lyase family enzyme